MRAGRSTLPIADRVCWIGWIGVLLCALLVGVDRVQAEDAAVASPAESVTIQLWPTAVVTAQELTMEDLGRVSGGSDGLGAIVRACPMGDAPPPGGSTVITLEHVTAALVKAGVHPPQVLIRGSSRCLVSRPANPPVGGPATTRPATQPAEAEAVEVVASNAEPGTLEEVVNQHLGAKLVHLGGTPQIRYSPAVQRALALSSPRYEFRLRDRGDQVLGLISLEADVLEGGRVVDTVPIVAEVALNRPVVVARTAINRGQVIKAKNLMLAERRFTRVSDIGLSDLTSLLGQESRRYIERGSMLAARDVQARALVQRGDLVTVWVREGDLVVKSVAKALRPGIYGETIDVKSEATGETFAVTVTGPQTAEVSDGQSSGMAMQEGGQ
ncbi:MAG: flagellar basal body P-ring formation protein FlgA [Phycisphaerae bacterium]|nr:flagellar basal body P-ring formation protein FlgA [Phycisphaerae bacterium]